MFNREEYRSKIMPLIKEKNKILRDIFKNIGLIDIKDLPKEFSITAEIDNNTHNYSEVEWTIEKMFKNNNIEAYHLSTPAYSNKTGRRCKLEEWVVFKDSKCVYHYWSKRSDHKMSLRGFKDSILHWTDNRSEELITIQQKIDKVNGF